MLNERSLTYTTDLSAVRTLVREQARHAGLTGSRAIDLELAVSEAAANTVRHAAAQGHKEGTLRVWCTAHEIVCEIRDRGIITDALAGRRQPAPARSRATGCGWCTRSAIRWRSPPGRTARRCACAWPCSGPKW